MRGGRPWFSLSGGVCDLVISTLKVIMLRIVYDGRKHVLKGGQEEQEGTSAALQQHDE